jgi:hypothetical protein
LGDEEIKTIVESRGGRNGERVAGIAGCSASSGREKGREAAGRERVCGFLKKETLEKKIK